RRLLHESLENRCLLAVLAADDTLTTPENTEIALYTPPVFGFPLSGFLGILANDSPADIHTVHPVLPFGLPAHGSIGISAAGTGTIFYVPQHDYVGSDSFTYQITDGSSFSTATVHVNVTGPRAVNDSYYVFHDTQLVVDAAHGVLRNDSTPD